VAMVVGAAGVMNSISDPLFGGSGANFFRMSDGWLGKNYLQGYATRTAAQMSGAATGLPGKGPIFNQEQSVVPNVESSRASPQFLAPPSFVPSRENSVCR
jgi:hypothetical protein